jgi:Zn-finger protein
MASSNFTPVSEILAYCRFCQKPMPAQLDRSIAENGRILDKEATYEYSCIKCHKTFCFSGNDLISKELANKNNEQIREYLPKNHYLIGEKISHKKFKDKGIVIGKEYGKPTKIFVQFEKNGLKKLVEDI